MNSPSLRFRSKIVAGLLIVSVITIFIAISAHNGLVGAAGQGGTPDTKPETTPEPPAPLTWSKTDVADKKRLRAESVTECPLDLAGCLAADSILAPLSRQDSATVIAQLRALTGEDVVVGSKPGLQLVGAAAVERALKDAASKLTTVAIGCPQENALGREPAACAKMFVLALDISGNATGPLSLAFLFAKTGHSFELIGAEVEPYLDVGDGGSASGFALPLELTDGVSGLWYTPWIR